MTISLKFDKTNWSHWLSALNEARETLRNCPEKSNIIIVINKNISVEKLEPWHIVSLACLIAYASKRAKTVGINAPDSMIAFFRDDLHLDRYFTKDNAHVESESKTILNLWKVNSKESAIYSSRLSKYLKQTYFNGKDISMLSLMLDELYANIADHSQSSDIAYSYIRYFPESQEISVAFCDFGIGIPASLKQHNKHPLLKQEYIKYATQRGVTIKSNQHNAGFGLATVLDCMEGSKHYLRIISNDELYYHMNMHDKINEKTFTLNQPFDGTLIFYNLDISQFESEEILGYGDLINDNDW